MLPQRLMHRSAHGLQASLFSARTMTGPTRFPGKAGHSGDRSAKRRFDAGFMGEMPFFGMAPAECRAPGRRIPTGTSGRMRDVFRAAFFERERRHHDDALQQMLRTNLNELAR